MFFRLLNDKRILTIQRYSDEKGNYAYKLCIYSTINGDVCDINIDIEEIKNIFITDDENVIFQTIKYEKYFLKIIKIKKYNIEEIWKLKYGAYGTQLQKLLNNNFLIGYNLYIYERDKLTCVKNLENIYENAGIGTTLQINENEIVIYCQQSGKLFGEYDALLLFDLETDKKINTLKLGDATREHKMFFAGGDNLLVDRGNIYGCKILLVDIKNMTIKNEFDYMLILKNCFSLNEKLFIYNSGGSLTLFEFEDSKTLVLKEEVEMGCLFTCKYPGNKLITCDDGVIAIYG